MRIHHVGVTVADMDQSLRFYRDLLGLPLLARGIADGAWLDDLLDMEGCVVETADLDAGDGQVVELLAYHVPRDGAAAVRTSRPGSLHVGVTVPSLTEALSRIRAAGGATVSRRPVTLDSEAATWNGLTVAYTRDPDGAIVELVEGPP